MGKHQTRDHRNPVLGAILKGFAYATRRAMTRSHSSGSTRRMDRTIKPWDQTPPPSQSHDAKLLRYRGLISSL